MSFDAIPGSTEAGEHLPNSNDAADSNINHISSEPKSLGLAAKMQPFKSVTIISSPYHVGIPMQAVGAGPGALLNTDLIPSLWKLGISVCNIVQLDPVDSFEGEIGKTFELLRRTSKAVTEAIDERSFPIVLAGNCCATVGVFAGIRGSKPWQGSEMKRIGCVWFDAHHDFHTPDTLTSGYLDGMGVSMLAGEVWKTLMSTIPNFEPMNLSRDFIHVGMRPFNAHPRTAAADFPIIQPSPAGEESRCKDELLTQMPHRNAAMVHIDADVLDRGIGRANKYAEEEGLSEEDLRNCLKVIASKAEVVSLTVASLDPRCDVEGTVKEVLVRSVVEFMGRLVDEGVIIAEEGAVRKEF